MITKRIDVKGIVQGVGFRPFVYRIAKKNDLKGYVKNMGNYVEIVVFGDLKNIDAFLSDLRLEKPPLSKIDKLSIENIDENLNEIYSDFTIKLSENSEIEEEGTTPPDISICGECLKEIMDKKDRRSNYAFTACTNCGPRFTVIEKLPYDRENTSMKDFPLCENCIEEYKNPENRRFHAQATCCDICGPELFITDNSGKIISKDIKDAVKFLENGKIVAIKGIGGTHLVCSINSDKSVLELRKRLNRPTQAFAIMSREEYLDLFSKIDENELNAIISPKKPIVALKKNEFYEKYFSEHVSNVNTIGVMLPYSGLHYLLFENTDQIAYIMTSANLPGLPMSIDNKEILKKLENIADYFLLHNRKIVNRCDDSVLKEINGKMQFLRRSRGFAPEPVEVNYEKIKNNSKNILALGPELNSVACLIKNNKFYLTQYIGNTGKYETFNYLKEATENLINITNTNKIDAIVCDLHPSFNSTIFAKEMGEKYGIPVTQVQHHESHCYSLMGDSDIFENNITIAIDGLGYGNDGNIWGGEVFLFKDGKIERIGHLEEQIQPGADLASKYPLRMLASILNKANLNVSEIINGYDYFSEKELKLILFQLEKNINVSKTTSTGRILDSISALVSLCFERTYDGEPSIRLEALANEYAGKISEIEKLVEDSIKIENNVLNTTYLVVKAIEMLNNNEKIEKIAYFIHIALANGLSKIAIETAKKHNIEYIGITGGVSYNKIISERIVENIKKESLKPLIHEKIPNGDGGISFGQAIGYLLNSN
ncbi:(NiFe) hydrogenase maturation protein HypF [Methanococcus maripaludis C5]|uniref:Carbamoyltransferase n=1 Tax=Methanococcus maripaludis (strain C5 / ATCC BAA-1333) TaxID=402880 RepID=A4G049_METM5|nr:carbamoyltransferase HypF [Methanococcus maripaludis]ABO35833.1 (NiFe) hydrogenase maturation protein HypF [Methanococcus maripaludis C5]